MDALVFTPAPVSTTAQTRPNSSAVILQMGFAVFAVLFYSGALLPLLRQPNGQDAVSLASASTDTLLNAVILALSVTLMLARPAEMASALRKFPSLWALPGLAALSVIWSTDPSKTLHASVSMWTAMAFAAWFAVRLSAPQQLGVLAVAMAIAMASSAALAFLDPRLGVDVGVHIGQWRGIYLTKNAFGRTMALAATVYLLIVLYGGVARPAGVLLWLCSIGLVTLSQSRTSLAAIAALIAFVAAQWVLRRVRIPWPVPFVILLSIGGLVALLVWSQRDQLAAGAASQDSLTGRTMLWALVGLKILDKPVLGYGYQAFWGGAHGDYVQVWKEVGWSPPHAHNGWLDVALDLGVVGYVLFAFVGGRALGLSFRALRHVRVPTLSTAWPAVGLIFVLVTNLTESTFLRSNLYWVLFTSCAILAAQLADDPGARQLSATATIGASPAGAGG